MSNVCLIRTSSFVLVKGINEIEIERGFVESIICSGQCDVNPAILTIETADGRRITAKCNECIPAAVR